MKVLGIDSSSISCSVGVWDTDKNEILAEGFINNGLTHSQTLLPMISDVLDKANSLVKDIDLIGVTKGPGSFTGLRIGMSTVKGLAAQTDIPCVCVSTLEAIAKTAANKYEGVLCAVMDARCNQVYNALFKAENGVLTRLCDDRAISIENLENELKTIKSPIILCGDGVLVCENNFKEIDFDVANKDFQLIKGAAVCALANEYKNEAKSPDKISPVYLRLPQASRELLKKKKEN